MPTTVSFDFAVVRIVPHVERQEFLNAGAILYCRALRFLEARIALDFRRLAAFNGDIDITEVERQLVFFTQVSAGDPAAGPIAALPPAGRFHWLVSPRSTVIQTSSVHSGLCADPATTLDQIVRRMVPGAAN